MSRAYTEEEVREKFLHHVRGMVQYWSTFPEDRLHVAAGETPTQARCSGVAFSILAAIDGSAVAIPGFRLYPAPHPSDRAYNEKHGENWFPTDCDIAGYLHSQFYESKTEVKHGDVQE